MGRASVIKEKAWERECARLFREVLGPEVRRGIGQARSSSEVADVETPAAVNLWIEAKVGARTNPRAALAQALLASTGAGGTPARRPVAVLKDDRRPPFVAMYLGDFLELLSQLRPTLLSAPPPEGSSP